VILVLRTIFLGSAFEDNCRLERNCCSSLVEPFNVLAVADDEEAATVAGLERGENIPPMMLSGERSFSTFCI